MEEDILRKIGEQDAKLDEIYRSVEKTRRYFLWTLIVTVAVIVLPLIGALIIIPQILKVYIGNDLGL